MLFSQLKTNQKFKSNNYSHRVFTEGVKLGTGLFYGKGVLEGKVLSASANLEVETV